MNKKDFLKKTKIVNVVVSGTFDKEIDLEKIARYIPKSIYEPSMFSGLVLRKLNPKSTLIMFKSGKITSVGTKSEKEGKNNLKESAFDLGNVLKTKIHATKIKTVNVFAVSDIDQNIDLKKIVKKIVLTNYNPKRFAAAIILLNKKQVMVYGSGKIMCMGRKNENEAKDILFTTYKLLKTKQIID